MFEKEISMFRPDTIQACWALRVSMPDLTDSEFIGHLNNLMVPHARELVIAARYLNCK